MAQATNDEIQSTLSKLLSKLELLEKKRKFNRNLNFLLSTLILCAFLGFGYGLTQPFSTIDLSSVLSGVSHSALVQKCLTKSTRDALQELAPALQKECLIPLARDPELFRTLSSQTDVFLEVAQHDLSKHLTPLYQGLVQSQKEHLEKVFPEIKGNPAVHTAIDHLIRIGAPKLKAAFVTAFQEHIQALLAIQSKVRGLKDESLKKMPSLEKAVLGVTLELFGKLLREEGEKAHE